MQNGRLDSGAENWGNYRNTPLLFLEDKILAEDGSGEEALVVMHAWESSIMKRHAEVACFNQGDVLEIGFGMGISAEYIQSNQPRSHTIVEIHPEVMPRLREFAATHENVIPIYGDWFEIHDQLGKYDGILYDTICDVNYQEFRRVAKSLVKDVHQITFFNVMNAAKNNLGFTPQETRYEVMDIDPRESETYFENTRKNYYLPIVC